MDALYIFSFESQTWQKRACHGGHESWTFGHAARRGKFLYAFGTRRVADGTDSPIEVSVLCVLSRAPAWHS